MATTTTEDLKTLIDQSKEQGVRMDTLTTNLKFLIEQEKDQNVHMEIMRKTMDSHVNRQTIIIILLIIILIILAFIMVKDKKHVKK